MDRRRRIQFALLLTAALAMRLVVSAMWQAHLPGRFGLGDSESYWSLGQTIAAGEPYRFGPDGPQVFRTPGYPLLLAPIFLLAGDDAPVCYGRLLSAVLGTLTLLPIYWLTCRLFDASAGMLAVLAAAFYPGAVAVGALVLTESPFSLLMLVQLALWAAACWAPSPGRSGLLALLAGIVAAAATLVRPSWLLFTPMAAVVGVLIGPGKMGSGNASRRKSLGIATVMLVGLVLTMSPWWIRNARLAGRFIPTTLQVGASLYDGLNPTATGASDMRFVGPFTEQFWRTAPADAREGIALEVQLNDAFRRASIDWARSHPGRVAQLVGVKLLRMWNLWPNEPSLARWPIRLVVAITFLPVFALGVFGAWKTFGRGWPYIICWLPAVYFTLLHVVFVSSIRYRQPAMLGLMILAAGAATNWKQSGKQEEKAESGGGEASSG